MSLYLWGICLRWAKLRGHPNLCDKRGEPGEHGKDAAGTPGPIGCATAVASTNCSTSRAVASQPYKNSARTRDMYTDNFGHDERLPRLDRRERADGTCR